MDISAIKEMASKDSKIDFSAIDSESMKIPQLHNKYVNLLHDARIYLRKKTTEYKRLYRLKWEYYNGKLDEDTLKEHGWEPFTLSVLKKDTHIYLDSDEDLSKLQDTMHGTESAILFLEETIKELNNRGWKLRNAIEWRKFLQGEN